MRSTSLSLPLAACLLASFVLLSTILLSSDFAFANEEQSAGPECSCPEARKKSNRPKFAELSQGQLDTSDEAAALESVQFALSQVADKQTYVWHRNNGRLSGIVQPTSSFRNAEGSVCRHLIVLLTTGDKTRKTEGIACRAINGIWQLTG